MTATIFNATTALNVIDLQMGNVSRPVAHPIEAVVDNVVARAAALRARHLPVAPVDFAGGAPGRTEPPRPPMQLRPDRTDLIPALNRRALEFACNVTLATDALTGRSAEAHAGSVGSAFPRIGETGAAKDIVPSLRGSA